MLFIWIQLESSPLINNNSDRDKNVSNTQFKGKLFQIKLALFAFDI